MSTTPYFKETEVKDWNLNDAIKSKIQESNFPSYNKVFQSVRSDLDFYDNPIAKNWKRNWKDLTYNFLLEEIPGNVETLPPPPSSSAMNIGTVTSSNFVQTLHGDIIQKRYEEPESNRLNKKQKVDIASEKSSQESSQESLESILSISCSESTEVDYESMRPFFYHNGENISETCYNFRNKCITDELDGNDLSEKKRMAINHVYLIDQDDENSSISLPGDFFEMYQSDELYPVLNEQDVNTITLVSQYCCQRKKGESLKLALDYLGKNNNSFTGQILYNLVNSYDVRDNINHKDESIFTERALNPFLNPIFSIGGELVKDGNFTNLIGNSSMKPDIKYSARIVGQKFDFLAFELKNSKSLAGNDLFKMSLELQFMINRLVKNNINNSVVYGVVGHGFNYDIYKMELVSPFVYLLIKVRPFFIPRNLFDFHVTLNTIPALLQLKELVLKQVAESKKNNYSTDKTKWIKDPLITMKDN